MAVYRYQAVSVGWWRGKIKRWNTTFHMATSNQATNVKNTVSAASWPNPGDTTGACSGGVASVSVYNAAGGPPISVNTYFDWQAPSTWIPFTGTGWAGVDPATPLDAAGESALVVVGNLAALSATGKPVSTRKYMHAVPSRTSADFADPDVSAATITAMKALFVPAIMLSPSGVAPTTINVEEWYGNHQRVRGRRRTTNQVAAQAFSLGVLAGGGATTSGQGEPFPGGEY